MPGEKVLGTALEEKEHSLNHAAHEFWSPLVRRLGNKRVILASGSPQRRELIKRTGISNFEYCESGFAEDIDKSTLTPWEYVVKTAYSKALKVYAYHANYDDAPGLVLAADTIVLVGNKILEKPKSMEENREMLKHLCSLKRCHRVITAVSCIVPLEVPITPGYYVSNSLCETEVFFDNNVSDELIDDYVKCGEGLSAAGGYKVQSYGSLFVKSIKGDFTNVIGLPVKTTYDLMTSVLDNAKNIDVDNMEDTARKTFSARKWHRRAGGR